LQKEVALMVRLVGMAALFVACSIDIVIAEQTEFPLDLAAATTLERGVFVARVVDKRADQDSVGVCHVGLLNAKRPVRLSGQSTAAAVTDAVARALPTRPTDVAVVLAIDEMWVAEQTKLSGEWATARVALSLHAVDQAGNLQFLSRAAVETKSRSLVDVTYMHKPNLERAIIACLQDLLSHQGGSTAPTTAATSPQVVRQLPPAESAAGTVAHRSALLAGAYATVDGEIGPTMSFLTFSDSDPRWRFPLFYLEGWFGMRTDDDVVREWRVVPGLGALYRLGDSQARLSVVAKVPLGGETIKQAGGGEETDFVTGIGLEQVIVLLPRPTHVFALAVGPFETYFYNSSLRTWDIGMKVQIGIAP
jgi:hypothetical protein